MSAPRFVVQQWSDIDRHWFAHDSFGTHLEALGYADRHKGWRPENHYRVVQAPEGSEL